MLQKCSIFTIASVFFDEPTKEHYLMEISKKTRLAHTSVKNYLKDLKKIGMITERVEKKGKRRFPIYKTNLNSDTYKIHKKTYNLLMLERSGVISFLQDKLMPKCIVVFGSYARGEDTEESDIDLFVECGSEKPEIKRFERRLHRKIELHFRKDFGEYPEELKNNISNGMTLRGYLEVFHALKGFFRQAESTIADKNVCSYSSKSKRDRCSEVSFKHRN